MNTGFDQFSMNHMITAISHEMAGPARKPRPECDTLFIGGPLPSDLEQHQLTQFGLRKNWKVVYPSFDPGDPARGPVSYHVVVTDGLTETMLLKDGRLWKKDRQSRAILVFADLGITIRISSRGHLVVRGMSGRHHDHGYELALEAITTRAAREPGQAPVLSSIGRLPTVLDIRTMNLIFANAE
ncbi:hypothetical protein [uncultured Sphingomonas sp.]|uniref:hypothetical protein n=1 Tax=uncultured Sphingomonas sp. TaxID=158754 RepID=UPI00374A8A65